MAKYFKLTAITESDAKQLKCVVDPSVNCYGSECMGWVWEYRAEEVKRPFPQPYALANEEQTHKGKCGMVKA